MHFVLILYWSSVAACMCTELVSLLYRMLVLRTCVICTLRLDYTCTHPSVNINVFDLMTLAIVFAAC